MNDPVQGSTGTLITPIRAAGAIGEVRVAIRGGTEIFLARADEPIPTGTTVLVVAVAPGRILDVVPWIAPDQP
ncbi:hypothetical protein [Nocardia stercoris]|uniref:hypothetical protein n=1 Tax=Nocardia stercoris TaxID=2483361 RepID=UPI0018F5A206|nr:hypothetical protein [Nocardia stercoris]